MAGTVSSRCVPNSPPNEWPKPIPTTSNGDRARRSHAAHEVDGAAEQAVRIRQLQNGRAPATAGSAMTHEDLEFVLDCTCPWLSTEESFVEAWYVREARARAGPLRRAPGTRHLTRSSNSPALTPVTKACHSSGV